MHVYGHRGAAGEAPENTLGGFRHAWERGARCFELDVQLAADEELVVVHDRKVDRTTNARGAVASLTSARLARLDARRGAPPWPTREGIPRLRAVLRLLPRAESWLIEVKAADSDAERRLIAQRLRKLIAELRIARKVVVISADGEFLAIAREVMPTVARGYVSMSLDALDVAAAYDCTHLIVNQGVCTPTLRLRAWRRNVAVIAWTVNSAAAIRTLHAMRLHGVVTDYPSMAVPLIGQLDSMSWLARARVPRVEQEDP